MQTTRRDWLRSAAAMGGVFVFSRGIAACFSETEPGDEDEASGETEDELVRCTPPVISANHGHKVTVPAADVTARVQKTYSIKGSSGHDHKITITKAQFVTLGAGRSITVTSTTDAGHSHSVTVSCAVTGDASAPDASRDGSTSTDAGRDVSSPDAAPAACGNGAKASSISSNHGHSLKVSKADVAAGTTKTYSIQGTSSHPHDVTITSAQFAQLAAGRTIRTTSTNDFGHSHDVTVICA